MSIRAAAMRGLLKTLGIRAMFDKPLDEILAAAQKANVANEFCLPTDGKRIYRREDVDGCPVLVAQAGEKPASKAILFLTGGGFTRRPSSLQLNFAFRLGDETASDVWIPYYPLCIGNASVRAPYDMCLNTYIAMLGTYAAEHISFVGLSAGGNMALGLLLYNNALGRPLPMPRQTIPISPGSMPVDEDERARAAQLDSLDLMIPAASLSALEQVMRTGETPAEDFMVHCKLGDYTGLPPVHLVVGGNEVMLALMPGITHACEQAGVSWTLTVGEGMWHCYPTLPLCPEAREGYEQIVAWLR